MTHVTIAPERPDAPGASALIAELEAHLEPLYPVESRHGFSVEKLIAQGVDFYVLRSDGAPVACGGLLVVDANDDDAAYGEIKRMYVRPAFRGAGFGRRMLRHLVDHARGRGLDLVRLETGIHQLEAIALYERLGFRRIPPFGPYFEDPLSRCYEIRVSELPDRA